MKFLKLQPHNKNIQAFTLLEVLASLAIVTMVIMGPLISAVSSSSYAVQSKDVMVATYLAEEALELLHYQNDSLYLQCIKAKLACDNTVPTLMRGSGGLETPGEKAWRLFKTRLDGDGSISCFSGCSYDFFDMSTTTKTVPTLYLPTSDDCKYLAQASVVVVDFKPFVRTYYACSGVPDHVKDAFTVAKTSYSRKVVVESKDTFEGLDPLPHYYDDLLITSTVTFRRSNGTIRTIKVTDFLRAHS